MSALYLLRFHGGGGAVLYIGNGKVLGMDNSEARYEGSYTDHGGRVRGTVAVRSAGTTLVGQPAPRGAHVFIHFDWPANFATGEIRQVIVGALGPVQASVEKIGNIP